jgi:hypothetical protein
MFIVEASPGIGALWQVSADLAGLAAAGATAAGSHSPADHPGPHDLAARHGLPGLTAGR